MNDDEALLEALEHAQNVASCQTGDCSKEHHKLANWLLELKLYREQSRQTDLTLTALRLAAAGDREAFDRMVKTFPEMERRMAVAFAEQTVFEELRQRELPKRKFPFECWHAEIRVLLEKLFKQAALGGEYWEGRFVELCRHQSVVLKAGLESGAVWDVSHDEIRKQVAELDVIVHQWDTKHGRQD